MKILDSEFRKELYKSLMDAGYEKQEAQKIVAVKYFKSLKEKVLNDLSAMSNDVGENKFNTLDEQFITNFNADMQELDKMFKIVSAD
jgi:hypothetical protein